MDTDAATTCVDRSTRILVADDHPISMPRKTGLQAARDGPVRALITEHLERLRAKPTRDEPALTTRYAIRHGLVEP